MTPDPEQIADDAMQREEALRLGGRFEPAHLALSLPCWLVGDLGSVVLCALLRRTLPSGVGDPGPATVAPAGSTWSGPGGDKWAEAL
jgi:hypothetical protein